MSVRAKMKLTESTDMAWNPGQKKLKFAPEYDTSIPEDQRYSKATPSGEITLWVDNPAALAQLKLGEYYYIDFTPVP